jgi:hypothetical protein
MRQQAAIHGPKLAQQARLFFAEWLNVCGR